MNSLNTKTHSSTEMTEFCFEHEDVKSICYCKQRMKGTLSLSSVCVEMKLCKLCTSFTSHLHSLCGMVWYRTLRVKAFLLSLPVSKYTVEAFLLSLPFSIYTVEAFPLSLPFSKCAQICHKSWQTGTLIIPQPTNIQTMVKLLHKAMGSCKR